MPTKIEQKTASRLDEFCEKLLALHGPAATLKNIRALCVEYGFTVSNDAADTFKKGPFQRHLERLRAGAEMRRTLTEAVGAGAHPLDAIEDAMVLELEDHLTNAEDGQIDIKFVVSQLTKLRMALSLREESKRKQADLERKQEETAKKLELADRQLALRDQQIAKLQAQADERAEKNAQAKAALQTVKKKGGLTKESLQKIEEAAKLL